MRLAWNPYLFPRTMTRDLWHAQHRWMRITKKALAADEEKAAHNIAELGVSHPDIAMELAMRLINPPLLLGPMFEDQPVNSRSSAVLGTPRNV